MKTSQKIQKNQGLIQVPKVNHLVQVRRRRKRKRKKNGGKKRKRKSSSKSTKKGKKRKKKKKSNQPKRKRSAYAFYMQSERKKFSDANPKAGFGDIAKIMGKHWREVMTDVDKKPFYDQAENDEARYEKEIAEYEDKGGGDSDSSSEVVKPRRKKRKKDPDEPKMSSNAYICWSRVNRAKVKEQHPNAKGQEINKICGQVWKTLSKEEKEPYKDEADRDKQRYLREMEEYKKNKGKKEDESSKTDTKKEES